MGKVDNPLMWLKEVIENNTGTMTLDHIRIEGIKALERHLGPEGMIRFLQQFETGRGDYTKERHKWLKETSVETLAKKIVKQRTKKGGTPIF